MVSAIAYHLRQTAILYVMACYAFYGVINETVLHFSSDTYSIAMVIIGGFWLLVLHVTTKLEGYSVQHQKSHTQADATCVAADKLTEESSGPDLPNM